MGVYFERRNKLQSAQGLFVGGGLDKEGRDDADTGYKDSPAHRETRDRTLPSQEQTLNTVSGAGGVGTGVGWLSINCTPALLKNKE